MTVLAVGVVTVMGPTAANADVPYCGPSKFIEQIQVADWGQRNFQIIVTPNDEARSYAAWRWISAQRSSMNGTPYKPV